MTATNVEAKPERLVGEPRFVQRPRMGVDADDRERRCGRGRHRGAGHARAATQIDHRPGRRNDAELANDVLDEEEVDWAVIECKRRALAGAVERLMIGQRSLTPFDVRG